MSECYLYVIATVFQGKPSSPVKIGISSNVESRLRSIQTSCPNEIVVVHSFRLPDRCFAQHVERMIHEMNSAKRSTGEWFMLSPHKALFEACCAVLSFAFDDEELSERIEEWLKATRLDSALDALPRLHEQEASRAS